MRKIFLLFFIFNIFFCLGGCGKYKKIDIVLDMLGHKDYIIQENLGRADMLYDFANYCYQKVGYGGHNIKFDYFMGRALEDNIISDKHKNQK